MISKATQLPVWGGQLESPECLERREHRQEESGSRNKWRWKPRVLVECAIKLDITSRWLFSQVDN